MIRYFFIPVTLLLIIRTARAQETKESLGLTAIQIKSGTETGQASDHETQNDNFELLAPVGTYLPNQLGFHNMSGNGWEFCEDWYVNSYNDAPVDGSAFIPTDPSLHIKRIIKGGGLVNGSYPLPISTRLGTPIQENTRVEEYD